jgi:chemotaxis response regulator CheB
MSKTRVMLVDDNVAMRHVVRALFDSHPHFIVCGEAEHGRDAVEKAPNFVLI